MTLPNGSNTPPLSLSDINTEFGYGTNLAAYRGKIVGLGAACKVIPNAPVSLADFYSTNKVVGGGPTARNGAFTVPQYKTITLTVQGGQAGQKGDDGYYINGALNGQVANTGGNGGPGGGSSIGSFVSAAGGSPNGGAGATNTVTLTNPLLGGTGPASGSSVVATVGGGGFGGGGGTNLIWNSVNFSYVFFSTSNNGAGGVGGSATTAWTGEP